MWPAPRLQGKEVLARRAAYMIDNTQKPPTINYPQCSKQLREFHQGVLMVVSCRNRRSPNYRNFVDPEHCNTCALRDGDDATQTQPPTPEPAAYTAGPPGWGAGPPDCGAGLPAGRVVRPTSLSAAAAMAFVRLIEEASGSWTFAMR